MEKQADWTVIKLLNWTVEYLQSRGFSSPRPEAEQLLGHVLNYKRLDLYLHFDESVAPHQLDQYRECIKRRLKHEPVQYITGETEFYSLPFTVRPGVLIPRPETEILVEQAITFCNERWKNEECINLLDMGTGSGNIAIALAKNLPAVSIAAVDISAEALEIARENAHKLEVENRIHFRRASLFEMGGIAWKDLHGIVSNPPYVSSTDFQTLPEEIRKYEPEEALLDQDDGFRFYPELCLRAQQWLCPGGFLIVEVAMNGAPRVMQTFKASGFHNVAALPDLNAIDRVVYGWKPASEERITE
ncbi:MAG: peptide chain release factor N(5)-glutamine methyltransferase [Patescibacteria group bacterium]|nr:peptide chain release factor N(5)-glutamine methyltransferase [Patescibacteria group bacterium]